jgi:hypothetical protein
MLNHQDEPREEDRAADDATGPDDQVAGEPAEQDDQEVLIDAVVAEDEDDPEPDTGDQQ